MIKLDEDILARLNQVYIDTRYPASLGSLPEGPPDIDDARDLNEFARAVYAQAKAILQAE
jgi:HEPN domain-containing protein